MSVKNKIIITSLLFSTTIVANTIVKKQNKIETPKTPLLFEENKGQFDEKVKYLSKGKGYNIALGLHPVIELFRHEMIQKQDKNKLHDLDLQTTEARLTDHAIFQMQIIGSNNKAKVVAQDKAEKKTNYISGKDKSKWTTNVENFSSIRYQEILQGVDVVYYGNDGRLEYDFIVKPQANVADIKLNFNGIENVEINKQGQLVLSLGEQEIIQKAPIAYQIDTNGSKLPVKSKYINTAGTISFEVGEYNRDKELVIDPVLEYSRYYGGSGYDFTNSVDVDANDNIYLIGQSSSPSLATNGAYQEVSTAKNRLEFTSFNYCFDCPDSPTGGGQVERTVIHENSVGSVHITKFTPDGMTILWSTYFNSEAIRIGLNSAAVSASGEVAFGLNGGVDGFPLVNSTQTFSETQSNVYVAKLNAAGNDVVFATYLSIGNRGWLRGLDVAADGSVAAVGFAADYSFNGAAVADIDFPEINPISGQSCDLDPAGFSDLTDGWVIHFNPTGTAIFASCIGGTIRTGSYNEAFRTIKYGTNGHLYLAGSTSMSDYPVVNPIQATLSYDGNVDTIITEIDPANSTIVFSSYLGPVRNGSAPTTTGYLAKDNYPYGIDVDTDGNIIVTGVTNQTGFPNINAAQPNLNYINSSQLINQPREDYLTSVDWDMYLTKINPTNSSIIFSTYLGGTSKEHGLHTLSLDSFNNSYIFSVTSSNDYPLANEILSSKSGRFSTAISKFSPLGALTFSSYHGGGTENSLVQSPGGMAINSMNKIILAANTDAADFTVVGSATVNSGSRDATLAIINQSGDIDTDGDGVIDTLDAFPADNTEWLDTDIDTIGNNADTDDDGDLVLDINDHFPLDATETIDTDGDGVGDNADVFPNDAANMFDLDGNGLGDYTELDADKDGVANNIDFRPFDATKLFDIDGDQINNAVDNDDDGDGIDDNIDVAPTNANDPIITFLQYSASSTFSYPNSLPDAFSVIAGSDRQWTSATDQMFGDSGTSISSLTIDHDQMAGLQYDEDFEAGDLSFQYKVDSEENFDFLSFAIDDVILLTSSGQVDWTLFTTPITAGTHKLTWIYSKNGSISVGDDAAWIDNISGAPASPVDLTTTVVNDDGIIVSNGTVNYTYTIYNNSNANTVNGNFQVTLPAEFSNASWTCTAPDSFWGSSCNTFYGTNRSQNIPNIHGSGIGNIDLNFDLGAYDELTLKLTADVGNIPEDGSVTLSTSVSVDNDVREVVLDNNTSINTSFSGIFANGFE